MKNIPSIFQVILVILLFSSCGYVETTGSSTLVGSNLPGYAPIARLDQGVHVITSTINNKKPNLFKGRFVGLSDDKFQFNTSLQFEPQKITNTKANILFILDISGSMAGSDSATKLKDGTTFCHRLDAIKRLLKKYQKSSVKFAAVTFGSEAQEVSKGFESADTFSLALKNSRDEAICSSSGGGTSFEAAFKTALPVAKKSKVNVITVFLSDGSGNVGYEEAVKEYRKVSSTIFAVYLNDLEMHSFVKKIYYLIVTGKNPSRVADVTKDPIYKERVKKADTSDQLGDIFSEIEIQGGKLKGITGSYTLTVKENGNILDSQTSKIQNFTVNPSTTNKGVWDISTSILSFPVWEGENSIKVSIEGSNGKDKETAEYEIRYFSYDGSP